MRFSEEKKVDTTSPDSQQGATLCSERVREALFRDRREERAQWPGSSRLGLHEFQGNY